MEGQIATETKAPVEEASRDASPAGRAPTGSPATWFELLAASPPDTRAEQVGTLQRTAGNQAVSHMVQRATTG